MNLDPQEMELAKYAISGIITAFITWLMQRRKTRKIRKAYDVTTGALERAHQKALKNQSISGLNTVKEIKADVSMLAFAEGKVVSDFITSDIASKFPKHEKSILNTINEVKKNESNNK